MIKGLLKLFAIFLMGCYLYSLGAVLLENITDEAYEKDKAARINACDRSYFAGNYIELREYLILYDAYDDEYDKYWEMVDGYIDYMQYKQWKVTDNASEQVALYEKKLYDNYTNCKFETNKNELKKYYEAAKGEIGLD